MRDQCPDFSRPQPSTLNFPCSRSALRTPHSAFIQAAHLIGRANLPVSPNISLARFPRKPNCAPARTGEKNLSGPRRSQADLCGPKRTGCAEVAGRVPHAALGFFAPSGRTPILVLRGSSVVEEFSNSLRGITREYPGLRGRRPIFRPRIPAFDRLLPAIVLVLVLVLDLNFGPLSGRPHAPALQPSITPCSIRLSKIWRLRFEISNLRSQILSSLFHF
jgi:hypothetical protein